MNRTVFFLTFFTLLGNVAHGQVPANDNFASAQLITGSSGSAPGSNVNATLETGEPTTTAGFTGGKSIWFRWVAPSTASITFGLTANFDTQLAIYNGSAVNNLTSVGESDPGGSGGDSVTFNATSGTTYRVRVTSYSSSSVESGPIVLNWLPPPANDNFADAQSANLASGSASLTSNNLSATSEFGETNFSGPGAPGRSVWYRISVPVGTRISLSTEGSDFNTIVSVFRQSSSGLAGLEALHGNDDADETHNFSKLTFVADELPGEYFISVDGYFNSWGNIALSISATPPEGPLAFYEKVISFTDTLAASEPVRRNGGLAPFQLLQGPDGSFFGCTQLNSNGSSGPNVFRIDPDGKMTTLFSTYFSPGSPNTDPFASDLVKLQEVGIDGYVYGISASRFGGEHLIFRMSRSGKTEILTRFTGLTGDQRGSNPKLLFQARDGNFYGATTGGGYNDMGTLFRMSATGNHEVLVDFSGLTGSQRGSQVETFFEAADGSFFGITTTGGTSDLGTVFRLTKSGNFQIIADFAGSTGPNRGSTPFLISMSRDGSVYGATRSGGIHGAGTVFRINTSTGVHQVIADLPAGYAGLDRLFEKPDGTFVGIVTNNPVSPPYIYTASIFTMDVNGSLSPLTAFGNENADHGRLSAMVMGPDGDLYGTFGSSSNFDSVTNTYSNFIGNVFKLESTGVYQELHQFGPNRDQNDGEDPNFLVIGRDGALYGSTNSGGRGERLLYNGQGVVYRITTDGDFKQIVQFGLPIHPAVPKSPRAALVEGADGNWYGTSCWGGTDDYGTIYKITPAGEMTLVKSMLGNDPVFTPGAFDGIFPMGELAFGAGGSLNGISTVTFVSNAGTGAFHDSCFFKQNQEGEVNVANDSVYSTADIPNYTGFGELYPYGVSGGLIRAGDDHFYGTSPAGALRIAEDGTTELLGGASITGNLVESSDAQGRFFYGAEKNQIFKMRPNGSKEIFATVVADLATRFNPTEEWTNVSIPPVPSFPNATVSFDFSQNSFFTEEFVGLSKGPADAETDMAFGIFVIGNQFYALNGNTYTFDNFISCNAGETYQVVMTINSNAFPTTCSVTVNGTVLASNYAFREGYPSVSGLDNVVLSHKIGSYAVSNLAYSHDNPGTNIVGGLFLDGDGTLYGTTAEGGNTGHGIIFKVSPAGGVTKLADFSGNGTDNKGAKPLAALMKHTDGLFYGTTSRGGAGDRGTIFRVSPAGKITTLLEFEADERDSVPTSRLVAGSDGNLYGATRGASEKIADGKGEGGVYRLVFDGPPAVYPMEGKPLDIGSYQIRGRFNARGAYTSAWVEYWTKDDPTRKIKPLNPSFSGYKTREFGVALTGLKSGITYSYQLRASSSRGANPTDSEIMHFSTSGLPIVRLGGTDINTDSAVFHATVNAQNAETKVIFEYGTNGIDFPMSVIGTSINATGGNPDSIDGETDTEVSASVIYLIPGVTYHYRARATNSAGTTLVGTTVFTTLSEPLLTLTAAEALSTTRAQVNGTVDARGSSCSIAFEWGTDGISFPDSVSASPASANGSGPVPVTATLTGLQQGTTYKYRIRATGPGSSAPEGTVSETRTFSLSILSGLAQVFPDPLPPGGSSVTVNFLPASQGAWRFEGETRWLTSGITAGHLASGKRRIEFLPVAGYLSPPGEIVDIGSNKTITLVRTYFETPTVGSGSLSVFLKPDGLGGKWRVVGESVWRDSGGPALGGLPAGSYLVECKPVSTVTKFVTPPPAPVTISNGKSIQLTLTYYKDNSTALPAPVPLDFASVATDEDSPFAYVGQIRSEVGSSTGFVVKRRVVATAAHVVFDDGKFANVTQLQWLFQRHAGQNEPTPQIPRGSFVATGYAATRKNATPGEGTSESQNLDYAALYFLEEAGRGGYGGYLASDSGDDNEFLNSSAQKILAGYAVDGTPPSAMGKLHATAAFTAALTPAFGETWTSTAVRGLGGCSGGPLFVRHSSGSYFPAAIYLGGSGQTVVRAIDSQVVKLFLLAEENGNGGGNDTGGGITHSSFTAIGAATQPSALVVTIQPEAARKAGAGWLLKPETSYRSSGSQRSGLGAGVYQLQLSTVAGFQVPTQQTVTVGGGQLKQVTFTYAGAPLIKIEQPKGTPLTDGLATIPIGSILVDTSTTKTFIIRNPGKAPLKNLKVTLDGKSPAPFSFTQPTKTTLAPGGSTTFKLTFRPSEKGSYEATLHVASNDSTQSPFDIKLTGKGVTKTTTIARLPSWTDLHDHGALTGFQHQQHRFTPSVVTLPDGRRYRALTVEKAPDTRDPTVEVSSDLVDWHSGHQHTTVLLDDLFRLKVRDNTPFSTDKKRFIRLKTDSD